MDEAAVTQLFTRSDGSYLFARWGRPLAPVVFGVDDRTISILKGAIEAVVTLADHSMAETDPELGANLMIFFLTDWAELSDVPQMGHILADLDTLVPRLQAAGANQYRSFRFDEAGGIKAAFVFVRMDAEMSDLPAETIALAQIVQTILLWSDTAFTETGPLVQAGPDGPAMLRPEIAQVIRAGYDPVMPVSARDPSHGLRLAARIGVMQ
ncbi:hypothetical protein HKCCE3408_01970 [Rhodobacterales bacterium HKCCE3408]|nr:hypothetical protein [Rhodobacterales bacterium HKCCE3408]